MKFSTVASILINVVTALAVYLPPNTDLGNVKVEPLDNIYSNHIPRFIVPLNLTTGELKLFAGHSFQLIKSKCPAVSQERLGLINKYITKLISRNPVPGSSPIFKNLVNSISTCTQHQITEEEKSKRQSSFFQLFFNPLKSLHNLWADSDPTTTARSQDPTPSSVKSTGGDSILVELSSTVAPPDTIPLNIETESVQPLSLFGSDDTKMSLGKIDDDSAAFAAPVTDHPDEKMPATGVNEQLLNDALPQGSSDTPTIRIFYTSTAGENNDKTEESHASWNPFGWLGGIFRAIQSFFFNMFEVPNPTPIPIPDAEPIPVSPDHKTKRDIFAVSNDLPTPNKQVELLQEIGTMDRDAPAATIKGKDAFLVLMDNMCRIYCDECLNQDQIRNYKAAAKELLQFILTDSTGVELAAKHFLEPDFLQSLNDC